MADLAIVFHWAPETMDPMCPGELMAWRDRAARRSEPEKR
jgi:hypothetical protein